MFLWTNNVVIISRCSPYKRMGDIKCILGNGNEHVFQRQQVLQVNEARWLKLVFYATVETGEMEKTHLEFLCWGGWVGGGLLLFLKANEFESFSLHLIFTFNTQKIRKWKWPHDSLKKPLHRKCILLEQISEQSYSEGWLKIRGIKVRNAWQQHKILALRSIISTMVFKSWK